MPEGTITSKNMPQPGVLKEPRFDQYNDVEAIPPMNEDFLSLKPKNPNIVFRGVNYKVGDGQSTLRYQQARSMGFLNATMADIEGVPSGWMTEGDKIIAGDLILMKIEKAKYRGWLKWRKQQAEHRGRYADTKKKAVEQVRAEVANTGAPTHLQAKIRPFVPSDQETEKLVGVEPVRPPNISGR